MTVCASCPCEIHAALSISLQSTGSPLVVITIDFLLQDDKDLVHEFVNNDGLDCLIKVGSEADQNYQNYILRGKHHYIHTQARIHTHTHTPKLPKPCSEVSMLTYTHTHTQALAHTLVCSHIFGQVLILKCTFVRRSKSS